MSRKKRREAYRAPKGGEWPSPPPGIFDDGQRYNAVKTEFPHTWDSTTYRCVWCGKSIGVVPRDVECKVRKSTQERD